MTDEYGLSQYPWEPVEGESGKAYAAFIVYRDLGARRTMRKAAAKYYALPIEEVTAEGGKVRQFERWSGRFKWVSRSEEWDRYLQHEADIDELQAVKDMRARHVTITTVMQSKAIQYLNTITDADLKRMTPDTAMRMLDLAIKNERLARGVPDTIQAHTNAEGGPMQAVVEVSEDALDRRFTAWLQAHDPENRIEAGEPLVERHDDLDDLDDEE